MNFAAKVGDVPNFGKKAVQVEGQEILLVNIKGTIYAVENECPHQGSPMGGGIVKEGSISCPRHGYRFSLKDGSCSDHPEFTLKVFTVQIEGDDILVGQ